MQLKEKLNTAGSLNMTQNRFPLAGILVAIPLVAALFYGVVGADKFLLVSPLVILGYACLAGWIVGIVCSRNSASVAPPGFFLFLLFITYGVPTGVVCAIPYEAMLIMLQIGLFVGAYYVWGNSFALFRRSRAALGWVIFFALLTSLYGLVNLFKQPDQVLWVERYAPYVGRLPSTYICPNHFAHLLQMLLPFCLVLTLIPKAGIFLRILSGYSFFLFLPVLFLTESRAGWLGSLLAVGGTICLLALRKSKKLFLLLVILVPLSSALLLAGAWRDSETFQRRMEPVVTFLEGQSEGGIGSESRDFRPQTWMDTIDMIMEKPEIGYGPASYRYAFPEHRNRYKGHRIVTGHPHNEYLELISEYGLIGFGLFALAWCYGLIRILVFSLKTSNQHHAFMAMAFLGTAAGTMLHSFFDFQMHIFQNALVFSLLAAIAVGPICGRRQDILKKKKKGIGFRIPRMALAILAVAGLLFSLQAFSSAFIRAAADRLVEKGDSETAKRYYQRAIKIDSSNWRAYKGIGAVYFKERYHSLDPDEKRELAQVEKGFFAAGYLHNSLDAVLVFDYGMATLYLGDTVAGLALLEKCAALRPYNDIYWWRLGIAQRKAGQYEAALESFRYAKSLVNSPVARKNIQWLEKQLNPPAERILIKAPPRPASDQTEQRPAVETAPLDELLLLMESL